MGRAIQGKVNHMDPNRNAYFLPLKPEPPRKRKPMPSFMKKAVTRVTSPSKSKAYETERA